jgi:hypothetical protein
MAKNALNSSSQIIKSQIAAGVAAEVSQAMINVPFPFGIMAASAAGAAANGLFSMIIPKFANGGIISGPTLGLMGEYSGARSNPEVVAPLNRLKGMLGGEKVVVLETVLKGEDIYLSQVNYNDRRTELIA